MKRNLMIRGALLGVATLLAVACFSDEDYTSKQTTQILVRFEPDMEYQWDDFVNQLFNGGQDTVSIHGNFSIGPVYHFAKLDGDELLGGIILARGHDNDASPDRKPSRFAVYGTTGNVGSKAYAVFHDTTAVLMPEHCIQIYIPNEASSCSTLGMFVHNVQAAVQAAKYGVGLADGPFQADDYLTLTISGYKGTTLRGSKEVTLIEGTKAIDKWTEVDLKDIGKVDAVELHLTSSRADFPLYCCLDDMAYYYEEIY